ncbi:MULTISPECIES: glycosyltransferase family 39 protein [unclassified Paludibacterium]|uniref:ArnT family glycosyltransferase n=1 Tax=unclassified Paludibacterium TaxID=2618429 RepID=UPI001C04F4F5|nr:glycosyltransferase family 39 protein [Paludibacterium sp. B53371]BEV70625.1 glycosyltransferase family 39 protein [Paludibacterium sp. THUN1379]
MLTYSPDHQNNLPRPTEKPWVLLLLAFIWLWPAIIGHDPWKPDEPFVLAVVQDMLAHGHWLVPTFQGEPWLSNPPLYYWVASFFVRLFSPWLLPAHDAARLATPLFMALALTCVGGAARELIGRRHGRSAVLILIGCIGLVETGHQMTSSVASFTGYAAAFYALALCLRLPALSGALLGLASTVLFLSSSLLDLMLLWSVVLLLPLFPAWRNKRYAITVTMALLFGLPLLLVWPVAFARYYPALFDLWWHDYALGELAGFSRPDFFHDSGYYLKTALWYAWPAWPLAGWTLYRRRHFDKPMMQLPGLFFAVIIILLTLSGMQATKNTMPLLLPLALMAAIELDTLRRGAAAALNWFALMTFGFFGLLVWFGWAAMNFGWPERLAGRAHYFSPYYVPHVSVAMALCGLFATLVWIWALTRRNLRGRQAVTNWAAGLTLLWGLIGSLWLPWLDALKSYRPVVVDMVRHLPADAGCVSTGVGNLMGRVSWQYYAGMNLSLRESACELRLIIRPRSILPDPAWQVIWQGSRPREDDEIFVLERRRAH